MKKKTITNQMGLVNFIATIILNVEVIKHYQLKNILINLDHN